MGILEVERTGNSDSIDILAVNQYAVAVQRKKGATVGVTAAPHTWYSTHRFAGVVIPVSPMGNRRRVPTIYYMPGP
jgi:hypothetical protein